MLNNDSTKKVALLGAGYIAEWHAKAILRTTELCLHAVCDKSLTRANETAQLFRIPRVFGTIDELAQDSEIDSVHILLPPDLHAATAMQMLQAGKNVFVEKPMCLNVVDCRKLSDLATEKNLRLGVGHNFLFHPAYEKLRRDFRDGNLGWVDHIVVTWHKELPQLRHGPFGIWMLREPGNVLLEIGSHVFSYLIDLIGSPTEITVRPSNFVTLPLGVRIPQQCRIYCEASGKIADVSLSLVPGFSEHTVHVRGSLGSATADLDNNTYVLRTHTASPDDFDRYNRIRNESKALSSQAKAGLYNYLLSKFIKSVPGNTYGHSIELAIRAFYGDQPDERISGTFGEKVISLCNRAIEHSELPVSSFHLLSPKTEVAVARPTVLVLGATGFIGQELCRKLLADGHSVRVLVRDPYKLPLDLRSARLEVVQGSLENEADLGKAMHEIHYVYHLAKAAVKRWADYQKHDVEVTVRIAEACLKADVKLLIYTGTIDSYYAGRSAGVIREDTPLDPNISSRNLYARAKALSEAKLSTLHNERKLPVVIVRPGIVIGRGGSPFHWGVGMWHFSSLCQVWGHGDNKLPLVLVEDVASGLASIVGRQDLAGQSLNLIGEPCLSAREYLDALESYAGIKLNREYVRPWRFYLNDLAKWVVKLVVRHPECRMPSYRDWETRTQQASFDCTRTKGLLNWNPESKREELIRKGIHVPVDELRS